MKARPVWGKLWIVLSAVLLAALGVLVIYGMVIGATPDFERGRSSTSSVVAQEVIGLLTLLTVGASAVELVQVVRGKAATRLLLLLLVVILLAAVWWIAYAFERAS